MSTSLHRTLAHHWPHPRAAIWPSVMLAILFVGFQWLIWLLSIVYTRSFADTVYALPGFLLVSQLCCVALLAYLGFDGWRQRQRAGRLAALVILSTCAATLAAMLVFLRQVAGQYAG